LSYGGEFPAYHQSIPKSRVEPVVGVKTVSLPGKLAKLLYIYSTNEESYLRYGARGWI